MSIQTNTFAEACYNMNAAEELETALSGDADQTDLETWGITAEEWRVQIQTALEEMREDA